jgi:hypothetical protein
MDIIPFFPNPFTYQDYKIIKADENRKLDPDFLGFNDRYNFINSGRKGILLLLESFHLRKNSRVGLPPLICNSVAETVRDAGLNPYFLDISNEFQLEFDEIKFNTAKIKALILPHLYGTIHPGTEEITEWCRQKSVYLINDTAQSFKIEFKGSPLIECGNGGVYSFGPGKSSTCAGGAMVYGVNKIKYTAKKFKDNVLLHKSERLLRERIAGLNSTPNNHVNNKAGEMFSRLISTGIGNINYLQFNSIKQYLKIESDVCLKRSKNWQILYDELDPDIFTVPEYYKNSQKFKFVFYLNLPDKAVQKFKNTLKTFKINVSNCARCNVPSGLRGALPNYFRLRNKLCEISTEASIPGKNFLAAARIMNNYFYNYT